jgi:hypothetical protein
MISVRQTFLELEKNKVCITLNLSGRRKEIKPKNKSDNNSS